MRRRTRENERAENEEKTEAGRKEASFQLFAWLGSGHLGNTKTPAKEQEASKEKSEGAMRGRGRR